MQVEFVTVDVFTDRRFGGNPLAVVPNAAGLSATQMQAIANEFNLSETTFVLPPKDPAHTAEVRIFTPKFEMPFAGHPNVGTAFVVGQRGYAGGALVFEEKAGLVPLELLRDGGAIVGARLTAPQLLKRGEDVSADIVAAACGLEPGDIETGRHVPCVAGCGTVFIFAEVKTRRALEVAQPRGDIFTRYFPVDGATGIHLYLRDGINNIDICARMFAPLHGVPEDPATGSANVALAGLLANLDPKPDLSLSFRIAQGVEMGRPSLLEASAEKRGGKVIETRIGGRCVAVMPARSAFELSDIGRCPPQQSAGRSALRTWGDAMTRILLLAAALVLYATAGMAQTKATIDKLNEAWLAAFNKGDAATIAAMYTDDATVLPQGGPMVKGATAIKDLWAGVIKDFSDPKITTLEVHTMGEVMAYEIGTVAMKTKASPPQDVSGKYVVVWRRSGTTWKLAVDIFNFDK